MKCRICKPARLTTAQVNLSCLLALLQCIDQLLEFKHLLTGTLQETQIFTH